MDGQFEKINFTATIDAGTPSATLLPTLIDKRYIIKNAIITLFNNVFQLASRFRLSDSEGDIICQSGDDQFQPNFSLEDIVLPVSSALTVSGTFAGERLVISGYAEIRG